MPALTQHLCRAEIAVPACACSGIVPLGSRLLRGSTSQTALAVLRHAVLMLKGYHRQQLCGSYEAVTLERQTRGTADPPLLAAARPPSCLCALAVRYCRKLCGTWYLQAGCTAGAVHRLAWWKHCSCHTCTSFPTNGCPLALKRVGPILCVRFADARVPTLRPALCWRAGGRFVARTVLHPFGGRPVQEAVCARTAFCVLHTHTHSSHSLQSQRGGFGEFW